jgi:hypothetical protein
MIAKRSATSRYQGWALLLVGGLSACSPEPLSATTSTTELGLASGPQIGPEFPITETARVKNAISWGPDFTSYPKPAWNGSAYLVLIRSLAWRFDVNGKPLDPLPFLVPAGASTASNGRDWLLAWAESGSVRAARVSAAGSMLDPTGFHLATTSFAGRIELAWDGTNYLVVWGAAGDIYGARVTPSGTVLDATPIAIAVRAGAQSDADVAWAGTHYVVVWQDSAGAGDIAAARVAPSGAVLDPAGIVVSADAAAESRPDVASSGTESLVLWQLEPSREVRGSRVSAGGVALDKPAFNPAPRAASEPFHPSVSWDGTGYIAYYALDHCFDAGGHWLSYITPAGTVSAETGAGCAWWGVRGAIGSNGAGQHLLIRGYRHFPGSPEYSASVQAGSGLTLLGEEWFATSAQPQDQPRIATDGARALVVWREPFIGDSIATGQSAVLSAARLSSSGTSLDPLDPNRLKLSTTGGLQTFISMDVAASANGFFATHFDSSKSLGLAVPASGPPAAGVSLSGRPTSVMSNGVDYLVAWDEGNQPALPRARRFSADGSALDSAPTALALNGAPTAGVWNGANYFVVWAAAGIKAARLTATGTLLDGPISLGSGDCPDVAWDGTNHLVVWSNAGTVYGARVDAQSAALDPNGFALGSGGCPRVAYNGAHHVVVWAEGTPASVRARRVAANGTIVDSSPFTVQSPGDEPDVASFGDGRALVVYSHHDPAEAFEVKTSTRFEIKTNRVWMRIVSDACGCDGGTCDGAVCLGTSADAGPDAPGEASGQGGTSGGSADATASDTGSGGGPGGTAGASNAGGFPGGGTGANGDGAITGGTGAANDASDEGCSACALGPSGRNGTLAWLLAGLMTLALRRRPARTDSHRSR